jgi:hypothetical protein
VINGLSPAQYSLIAEADVIIDLSLISPIKHHKPRASHYELTKSDTHYRIELGKQTFHESAAQSGRKKTSARQADSQVEHAASDLAALLEALLGVGVLLLAVEEGDVLGAAADRDVLGRRHQHRRRRDRLPRGVNRRAARRHRCGPWRSGGGGAGRETARPRLVPSWAKEIEVLVLLGLIWACRLGLFIWARFVGLASIPLGLEFLDPLLERKPSSRLVV